VTDGGATSGVGALATARLQLAPFRDADADALFRFFRDPHVRRYMLDGTIVERDWVVEEIAASRARFAAGEPGLFAARLPATRELVGITGFRRYEGQGVELVYALLPTFCGSGFATEMARAMVELAFGRLGWREVHATIDAPNRDSVRVVEGLGFARYGEMPGAFGTMLRFVLRAPA
jgi:RimJ/RimL family protein N-acetyltransferase